jgi:hypothetical protein
VVELILADRLTKPHGGQDVSSRSATVGFTPLVRCNRRFDGPPACSPRGEADWQCHLIFLDITA